MIKNLVALLYNLVSSIHLLNIILWHTVTKNYYGSSLQFSYQKMIIINTLHAFLLKKSNNHSWFNHSLPSLICTSTMLYSPNCASIPLCKHHHKLFVAILNKFHLWYTSISPYNFFPKFMIVWRLCPFNPRVFILLKFWNN